MQTKSPTFPRRLLYVTSLAFLLAAPVGVCRADQEEGGGSPTCADAIATKARSKTSHSIHSRRRRGGPSASRPLGSEISPEIVELASAYLHARSTGIEPTPVARSAWEDFHAWADARIRKFASAYRARGVNVDDCAQETWVHLAARLPEFRIDETRGKFSTWLYTVVRSKAIDQLRRNSRLMASEMSVEEIAGRSDDPPERCIRRENRAAVKSAMQRIKPHCSRESYLVLEMRMLEEKDVGEVADALGLTPSQVWTREHRMKRKLRTIMASTSIANPRHG